MSETQNLRLKQKKQFVPKQIPNRCIGTKVDVVYVSDLQKSCGVSLSPAPTALIYRCGVRAENLSREVSRNMESIICPRG